MEFKSRDLAILIGAFGLLMGSAIVGWALWGTASLVVLILLSVMVILGFQVRFYRNVYTLVAKIARRQIGIYRQTEALFSLYNMLDLKHPLPSMWQPALAPDMAVALITLIREKKPRVIFEIGSGVSTLISAHCLRELGRGKVYSLEHERRFADITTRNLRLHGLEEHATVAYAPLKEITLNGKTWKWYDISNLKHIGKIDMLFVDGPPGNIQPQARYPALPILFGHLSEDALVILDDGYRQEEQKIAQTWLKEFNCFELEELPTERRALLFRRVSPKYVEELTSPEHEITISPKRS